jgi:hypothetical protein
MDSQDLVRRFTFHPANSPDRVSDHERVRQNYHLLAEELNGIVPEGREKSLAITRLEEVMFWANAGIARLPEEDD